MNIDMDARSCHVDIRGQALGDTLDKATRGACANVTVGLWYNAVAPFEVELLIEDVLWTCARDLLRDGLFTATGLGDVRIWPHGDQLAIRLRNIGVGTDPADWGTVIIYLPRLEVAKFVTATHKVVPPGRERVDIDTCLAQLLGGDRS